METFLQSHEYKIVDFCKSVTGKDISGNLSLELQVNEILSHAEPEDSLFIAFDNIGSATCINKKTQKKFVFDSGEFLSNTYQKCQMKEIDLYVTSYYCFEEIYLSYIEWKIWLPLTVIEIKQNVQKNKEHFADALFQSLMQLKTAGLLSAKKQRNHYCAGLWIVKNYSKYNQKNIHPNMIVRVANLK